LAAAAAAAVVAGLLGVVSDAGLTGLTAGAVAVLGVGGLEGAVADALIMPSDFPIVRTAVESLSLKKALGLRLSLRSLRMALIDFLSCLSFWALLAAD
jgi:hypothetical protein